MLIPKTTTIGNPYHIPGSEGRRLFFGRQDVFGWIFEQIAAIHATSDQILVLHGPPEIGKTAVLKQIETGALNPPFVGIYLDFAQVALDSLSAFYWEIANAGLNSLARLNLELDTLNQSDFIADPAKALQQQFLQPTSKLLQEKRPFNQTIQRRPLFLFDNSHLLLEQIEAGVLPADSLINLHMVLNADNIANALFAFTDRPESQTSELPALKDGLFYQLPPLDEEETVALARQPVPFTLVRDVAQYIYHITDGHPQKTHKLCHALYEHQHEYNLNQITVADVATVHKLVKHGRHFEH